MKQSQIKVFYPQSKKMDMTVRSFSPTKACDKLQEVLDPDTADKARSAFRSLRRLGGSSLTFIASGRRIKVELAHAA